jgi:signal transduction histidine kinase
MSVDGRCLFVGGMRDVTDWKNAQDELRQTYKMEAAGQITGSLVHDFNNLLGVILGNLELACGGEPTEVEKRLRAAIATAERGAALSHRLLAFSRKMAPALVPVRLDAAVASISELVSRTLGKTIDVQTESAPDLWFCQAAPPGVENALLGSSAAVVHRRRWVSGEPDLLVTPAATRLTQFHRPMALYARSGRRWVQSWASS